MSAQMSEELVQRLAEFDLNAGDSALDKALTDAPARIAAIYIEMTDRGAAGEDVARAMLGATVCLYDNLGLLGALPDVLRLVADRLEETPSQPH